MVGIAEISGAISGLKGALDLLKGVNATNVAVALNNAKIALQGAIFDAQEKLLAMQEAQTAHLKRIDDLEQEIVRLKDWSGQRERYELVNIWNGAVAYAEKASVEGRQAPHWLCANCFDQGRKSYMQTPHPAGDTPSFPFLTTSGA